MVLNRTPWSGLSVLAFAGSLTVLTAQQPTVKRSILQQHDISVPGREAVTAKSELAPGGTTGHHTHPGEEISYVLEGTLELEVAGQPTRTLKAGDAFIVPRDAIHNATNKGSATTLVLVTYIVDKGKPLATAAKPAK